jgi:hypothetical protein
MIHPLSSPRAAVNDVQAVAAVSGAVQSLAGQPNKKSTPV